MNKELQKLAIVAVCKWDRRQEGAQVWYEKDGKFVAHHNTMLNDLNAMHEVEKVLLGRSDMPNIYSYLRELLTVTNCPDEACYEMMCATAAQRCEAFLRTLNLWTPTGEENE